MAGPRGADGFETYYSGIYGHRWPALKAALLRPATHTALRDGLLQPYYLDPASVAVAGLLPLAGARRVLDLCAAPGGKALVIAQRLAKEAEPGAVMTANERSRRRRGRLIAVLDAHLPPETRGRVSVTGHDATQWGVHQPDQWDAILADVPCSSEQHVLGAPEELAKWSPSRVRRLAVQQGAILAAAVDSLRSGGHVLYVTCALSPEENDAVVEKILRKRADRVDRVDPPAVPVPGAETTRHGLHILPDRAAGTGPLYCALLRKR